MGEINRNICHHINFKKLSQKNFQTFLFLKTNILDYKTTKYFYDRQVTIVKKYEMQGILFFSRSEDFLKDH